jgi:hypothetical protein
MPTTRFVRIALRERLFPVLAVGTAVAAAPGLLIFVYGQQTVDVDGAVHF